MSDGREHGFLKWLLDLFTHAAWDAIKEIPKYLGTVFSLFIVLRQCLLQAYGFVFFLALWTFAAALIYIGLGRIRKKGSNDVTKKPAKQVATEEKVGSADPSRAEFMEKTSSRIYRPTLEEIKEYDPKLKKLNVKQGRAIGLVIAAIFAAVVWSNPNELGDFPPYHSDYPGAAPFQYPWAFLLLSLVFLVEVVAVLVTLVVVVVGFIRHRRRAATRPAL